MVSLLLNVEYLLPHFAKESSYINMFVLTLDTLIFTVLYRTFLMFHLMIFVLFVQNAKSSFLFLFT